MRGVLDADGRHHVHDRPNRGKSSAVEWALERYDAREDGAVVFAPTGLTAHRRAEVVRRLLQRAPAANLAALAAPRSPALGGGRAATAAVARALDRGCMPPRAAGGTQRRGLGRVELLAHARARGRAAVRGARPRVRCAHRHAVERPPPVQPAAYEQMDAPYALEWWRREEAVTRAEPSELGA